ncbi:MAG: AMP-binding protein [Thermoplasmata archaeon]|nr:AMP-binding protein [Candidatus Sysuiplasma jiujiangense]
MNNLTIPSVWHKTVTDRPDEKIVFRGMEVPYAEAYALACGFRRHALFEKLNDGDVVASIDFNTLDNFLMHTCVPANGLVFAPINPMLPSSTIRSVLKELDPRIVFVNRELSKNLDLDEAPARILETDGNWIYDNISAGTDDSGFSHVSENSGAVIVLTSGTTGPPKKILYPHRNIVLTIMAMSHLLASVEGPATLRSEDVIFDLIPLYHLFGWGSAYIAPLLGTRIILDGRFDPASVLKKIGEENVTWFNCVPTMIHFLLESDRNGVLKGRKILLGGSTIPQGLSDRILKAGMEFASIYGFSDGLVAGIGRASSREKGESPEAIEDRLRRSVTIAPFARVDIRKLDNSDYGEIYFSAPWLPEGYMNDPGRTQMAYVNGYFRTGDIGFIDAFGRLVIVDRVGDMIKSGGEWIPSSSVEALVSTHGAVASCAVVGIPDEKWGERPVCFIIPKKGTAPSAGDIAEHLNAMVPDRIVKWWIPDRFIFTDQFPVTGTGKIDKRELKNTAMRNKPAE